MTLKKEVVAAEISKDRSITKFKLLPNEDNLLVEADDLIFSDKTVSSREIISSTIDTSEIIVIETTGLHTGWNLQVKFKEFTNGTDEIRGAELFFPKITPFSTIQSNTTAPKIYGNDNSFLGTPRKGLILSNSSSNSRLADAGINEGYGRWEFIYENDERVQLKLPKGKKEEGVYTALLEYTLVSGP